MISHESNSLYATLKRQTIHDDKKWSSALCLMDKTELRL